MAIRPFKDEKLIKNIFVAAILVFPFFGREPLYCRFGSWHIWNQHTQKPLCANFHAFLTKCTTHPKFVTYLPHYCILPIIRIWEVVLAIPR